MDGSTRTDSPRRRNLPDYSDLESPTLLRYLWSNRRRFYPGLALVCGRIAVVAPFPIIFRHILDVQMPEEDLKGILLMSGLMVLLLLAHNWFNLRGATKLGASIADMVLHMRSAIFLKIQLLNFSYLDRQKSGRLLAKYAFDTQKIDGITMQIVNNFIPNMFYSLLTLIILIVLDWKLAGIIVLMLPIFAIARRYYFNRMQRRHHESREKQEHLTGMASEMFGALRLMRSYGEEQRAREQLHQSNEEVAESRVRLIRVSSSLGGFSWSSIQFLTLVVIAGGAILSIYGKVSPGLVLAFVAGLPPLVQPIQTFAGLADQYFLGQEGYVSIKELLDESDTERWHGRKRWDPIAGRLEFDNVTFSYPGTTKPALRDFTLTIEPGERVALVGSSGAGKSTIANLVLGLYAPSAGEIRIDGVPQRDMDVRWFRRRTAIVLQESVLLSGTITENLRFARENASDDDIRHAAQLAHASEFISRMPDGFKTTIGERGAMLSGGQRQRISIARALLRDPVLLILDEPTSALDYESERLIQQALDTLTEGRTVITIAHRLSTIRSAHRVIVMEEGRIVEQGPFAELSERGGYFTRMLAAQGGELVDDTPSRHAAG